jgi:hypothetical protein
MCSIRRSLSQPWRRDSDRLSAGEIADYRSTSLLMTLSRFG